MLTTFAQICDEGTKRAKRLMSEPGRRWIVEVSRAGDTSLFVAHIPEGVPGQWTEEDIAGDWRTGGPVMGDYLTHSIMRSSDQVRVICQIIDAELELP